MKVFRQLVRSIGLIGFAGGWALAASSLYLVRTPTNSFPVLITKSHLCFKDTYADTRKWTLADDAAHPALVARLLQAGRSDLLSHTVVAGEPVDAQLNTAIQNPVQVTAAPNMEDKARATLKNVTDAVKSKIN